MQDTHKNGIKNKERFQRRKTSKSPINIREKIKELEEQLEKHHKNKNNTKTYLPPPTHHNPPNPTPTPRQPKIKQSRYQTHPETHLLPPKPENTNNISPLSKTPADKINKLKPRYVPIQRKRQQSPPKRFFSPPTQTAQPFYQKAKIEPRNLLTQGSQQNLQRLRQQNQRFRQIYSQSVQKIQFLQQRLAEMREQQQTQKNSLETTFQHLQTKVDNKKNTLAHIYSFDNKRNQLLVVQDRIITETDNQNSSVNFEPSKFRRKSQEFSGLSIESK